MYSYYRTNLMELCCTNLFTCFVGGYIKEMPIVWFIRHGESQSNVGELTCNSKETRLTEVGHAQANEIIQAFHLPSYSRVPSLIVTSEYRRSQQTADPTKRTFPEA